MSIHPMASPTVCLVSIEVNSLAVTSDCSCLVIIEIKNLSPVFNNSKICHRWQVKVLLDYLALPEEIVNRKLMSSHQAILPYFHTTVMSCKDFHGFL